jgi:hypothetical protein
LLITKMRVFILLHLRQVDGIVPQTTYQEDSTDGVCLQKKIHQNRRNTLIYVYITASVVPPSHNRKKPTKNKFLVNFCIELT